MPPTRILVVDDERRNRDLLEVLLVADGHDVVTASCGEDALAMLAAEPVDLVLLDVMMPGMDGYQVVSRIRGEQATGHIPVVLISALDDSSSRAHGLRAGAQAFVTKPINRAEIAACVRQLLGSGTTR